MTVTVGLSASQIASWRVEWGDGSVLPSSESSPPPASTSHPYAAQGDYAIRFTVWDASNRSAESSVTAKIIFRNREATPATSGGNLLQFANLTYEGAFSYFVSANGTETSGNMLGGIHFDPAGNSGAGSLFVGNTYGTRLAEISIPALNASATATYAQLSVASVLQTLGSNDPTDGKSAQWSGSGVQMGQQGWADMLTPFLVNGSDLYLQWGSSYDGNSGTTGQVKTFLKRSRTLSSTGTASDFFRLTMDGSASPGAPGTYSAYTCQIPTTNSWQTRLGGTHLSGQFYPSIASRFGFGPNLFAWSPLAYNGSNNPSATTLLQYPTDETSLAALAGYAPEDGGTGVGPYLYYYSGNTLWNIVTQAHPVFPTGYDTVMFIGLHLRGSVGYGIGGPYTGSDPSHPTDPYLKYAPNTVIQTGDLDAIPGVTVGDRRIYDIQDVYTGAKGNHGHPYEFHYILYDANELEQVKLGQRSRYSVMPYAWGTIPDPSSGFIGNGHDFVWHQYLSATYDAAHKKIYVQMMVATGGGLYPIIAVYSHP